MDYITFPNMCLQSIFSPRNIWSSTWFPWSIWSVHSPGPNMLLRSIHCFWRLHTTRRFASWFQTCCWFLLSKRGSEEAGWFQTSLGYMGCMVAGNDRPVLLVFIPISSWFHARFYCLRDVLLLKSQCFAGPFFKENSSPSLLVISPLLFVITRDSLYG